MNSLFFNVWETSMGEEKMLKQKGKFKSYLMYSEA